MRCIVTICFLSTLHFCSPAQSPFYTNYQTFDEKDGYQTFGRPAYITFDKEGLLWIGGDHGLYRFDGTHFKNYRHETGDTNSLPFNLVNFNYQDRHGNYWVAVANFGLYRFFPETGKFKKWRFNNESRFNIHNYQLALPFEDRSGTLWFVVPNFGLARWEGETNRLNPYPICETNSCGTYYSVSWVTAAAEDPADGTFWLGSNDGLVHFFPSSGKFKVFRDVQTKTGSGSLSGNIINRVYFDNRHQLWLGTWGRGLKRFDRLTSSFKEYKWSTAVDGSGNICIGIGRYDSTRMWIATVDEGIILFDTKEKMFIPIKKITEKDAVLSPLHMSQRGAVLWLADARRLIRLDPKDNLFNYHQPRQPAEERQKPLSAFLRKGHIFYFGSMYNGHFNEYDFKTNKAKLISLTPAQDDESVYAIREDATGRLWLAAHAGTFLYHPDKRKIERPPTKKFAALFQTLCYDILFAKDGTCWLATKNGLLHYDIERDVLTLYPIQKAGSKKSLSNVATILYEDSKGNIWLGGNWGRLGCFRKSTGDIVYMEGLLPRSSVPYNYTSITEADDGAILFVIEYMGLGILKHPFNEKQEFRLVNSADGLPADYIGQVFKDNKNRIWLTTANGLCQYNYNQRHAVTFTTRDGLIANFSEGNLYEDGNGIMYIGFPGSFQTFNPDSLIPPQTLQVRIFISDFFINGKDKHINQHNPGPLRLNYTQNNLHFLFTALSNDLRNDFQYAYKLDGIDYGWVETGSKAEGQYSALPPGDYTLHIKATYKNSNWLPNEWKMRVQILPPWYQTRLFYTAIVLLAASLAYAFYRYRINRLIELQKLRMRIASDLHDDIGSSLSSIAYNSELVKMQMTDKNSTALLLLEKLEQTSRNVITSMSDIVWFISPKNDTSESLLNRLKWVAAQMLSERDIAYSFDQQGSITSIELPMQQRKNILLIFKEAIHNAIKHAHCTSVHISVMLDRHMLQLIVHDDGRGFANTGNTNGNGLYNMRIRAKEIEADLQVDSIEGLGTTVTLRITHLNA